MPDSFLAVAVILCFPELDVESVHLFFAFGFISFRIFVGSFFLVQLHCCEFLLECEFHLKSPSYGFGAAPMDGFHGIHPSLLLLLGPVRGVQYSIASFYLLLQFSFTSPKLIVVSFLCYKLIMSSSFDNLSVIHDHDTIGIANSR